MFSNTFLVASALALLAPRAVFANLYITEPVDSTTCSSGQICNVRWNDDGQTPALKDIGPCTIGLYAGNQIQQTLIQDITGSADVSTQTSVQFTPQPGVGPNSNVYFIRFTSLSLKDTTNSQYPFQGFSHKFTLNGMTGQFNATVQSQVDAATSTPASSVASATGSAVSSASSGASSVSASLTKSTSASSTASHASSASPSPTGKNGASTVKVGSAMGVVALTLAGLMF